MKPSLASSTLTDKFARLDALAANRVHISVSECAAFLGVAEGTLRNHLAKDGASLPFTAPKIFGRRMVDVDSLRRYLVSLEPAGIDAVASTACAPVAGKRRQPSRRPATVQSADSLASAFERGRRRPASAG